MMSSKESTSGLRRSRGWPVLDAMFSCWGIKQKVDQEDNQL